MTPLLGDSQGRGNPFLFSRTNEREVFHVLLAVPEMNFLLS